MKEKYKNVWSGGRTSQKKERAGRKALLKQEGGGKQWNQLTECGGNGRDDPNGVGYWENRIPKRGIKRRKSAYTRIHFNSQNHDAASGGRKKSKGIATAQGMSDVAKK